jgi:hypothetical protein
VGAGGTLNDKLSLQSTFRASRVLATSSMLEHLKMSPNTENAMKFWVTILFGDKD